MEEKETRVTTKESNPEEDEEREEKKPPREFSSRGINATRDSIRTIDSGSSMLLLVFKEMKTPCDGPCSVSKIKLIRSGSGCSQLLCRKSSKYKEVSSELKERVKGFSKKLKKTSRKSLDAIRNIYKDATAQRAKGFRCNLKECDSSILDCSQSTCKEKDLFFDKAANHSQKKGETSKDPTMNQLRPDCKSKCKFPKSRKSSKAEAAGRSKDQKETRNEQHLNDKSTESKLAKYLAGKDFYSRCKRYQVCECPDNPGKYFKTQGYAMCCCLNDRCVTFTKTEDKGVPDSPEEISKDKNASQEN